MNEKPIIFKGLSFDELAEYFASINQPKYRAAQLFNWMYNHLCFNFDEMQNFSKDLRKTLSDVGTLSTLFLIDKEISKSNTIKLIFKTLDDNIIESVIIPEDERNTLCVSTQSGCPLDCKFCATGLMGYKKNLSAGEIFDQYALAANLVGKNNLTNIVLMGMGEPLLNYKNTIEVLEIFSNEITTGISTKKITLSTSGITPRIRDLADSGIKVKLALSLHSCFDDIRSSIMPINKKYPLKDVIDAARYFAEKTKTRITFEYVMLKGINDREADIKALVKLCSNIPSKVNIIPFNSLDHFNPDGFSKELKPTARKDIEIFADKLRDKNITVLLRLTQGDDIAAACGQLAIKY